MTMTATRTISTATVATNRAARYGKQLVSHLGRRCVANWDAPTGSGSLEMGDGAARVALSTTPQALVVRVEAGEAGEAGEAEIAIYEDVVARHLQRFGERDELKVVWKRRRAHPRG
jgi:hypothetical protein